VSGLAQENKVNCVRLAVFAEMIKGRAWSPATLKDVGGTEGIGVTFLEDTFTSAFANPNHRLHQKAARAVLKALLPESGSDIKGNMRSEVELLAVSGYTGHASDFDQLLRILDSETRLITPTDPEGSELGDAAPPAISLRQRYYQLTHDYLVHSLRHWLTRKQKESRRGRAELRLAERAALWNSKPENGHLPSAREWARIRWLTACREWTSPQRKMMRAADRFYFVRCLAVLASLLVGGWAIWEYTARLKARALRDQLLNADVEKVPAILKEIEPHRRRVDPLLRDALNSEPDEIRKLRLRLGLVQSDRSQVKYLYERLLLAGPQEFAVIRHVLTPFKDELTDQLWAEFADQDRDSQRRFRAACALVEYAPNDPRWNECATLVVDGLRAENPLALIHWKAALQPVRDRLLPALAASLEESKLADRDRRAIIQFYRDFVGEAPDAWKPLVDQLNQPTPGLSGPERARRKSAVAATLAALGRPEEVWPLLAHTPDPTLRSYLIERLANSDVDPKKLKQQLDVEKDCSARRALILVLGGFPRERMPDLVPYFLAVYETDPDAGIHAAAAWVLHAWGKQEQTSAIDKKLASTDIPKSRRWFVNTQLQTFAIIPRPQPEISGKDMTGNMQHLAIGATEVTLKQFRQFRPKHKVDHNVVTSDDSPVNQVTWYQAVEYCNWLSEKEGIPKEQWCYQPDTLDLVPAYCSRTGYRLPTEYEWEFACKAGSKTAWSFGEANKELLGNYAWFRGNADVDGVDKCFPVGLKKPNDWGLFDMHGNLNEWCQESIDPPKNKAFPGDVECVCRGGSFAVALADTSSHARSDIGRKVHAVTIGFRVVRSLP
jgi:hypothetical protein